MTKKLLGMVAVLVLAVFYTTDVFAQTSRASVPASEVNGTFRYNFTGKYRGSYNEIKILALGKGKLKVGFDLTYPFTDGTGQLSANVGQAIGIAEISGDTAVYRSEDGDCRIIIKFAKPGTINVEQQGASSCGFGHNVSAGGNYRKANSRKPVFSRGL
jgi:hypothetical protein